MELIFDEILIIDELNKKAKKQKFLPGINVVVSNGKSDEGNYIGKSTLLKSIFHALGADAFFPKDHDWELNSKYFYILKFTLDSSHYTIMRCANVFYIYNENGERIFKCNERIKLSEFYSKLFGFRVLLKDNSKNKEYALAQPFSFFALNFVDQFGYDKKTGFLSFDRIGQYTKIYGDLIFSHMGLDNEKLNKLYDEQNRKNKELNSSTEERVMLKKILDTLIVDEKIPYEKIEVLKKEISIHKEEYDALIKKYDLAKQKLYELSNTKSRILNEINTIKEMLANNESDKKTVLKKHRCPLCSNTIENYTEVFFKKAHSHDSLSNQLISYDSELIDIEKEINKEYETYAKLYKEMENLEESIGARNDDVNTIVKRIGLKEYKENIINKYNDIVLMIDTLNNSLKDIRKEITPIKKLNVSIDENYKKIIKEAMIDYKISVFNYNEESIDVPLSCSDPHILFTVWLTSLYKLKRVVNPNGLFIPFVIDNPTDRDFEGDNYIKTLKMIFDLSSCCKQVITSKVVFDDSNFSEYDINKIIVDNKKYSLLNDSDYKYCCSERDKLQII